MGPWGATLSNRYKGGYTDQDGTSSVGSYSVFDVTGTWTGVKNLTLTAGMPNLFDTDPPLSVQNTTFQRGYDPRFTSPLGRTFTLYAPTSSSERVESTDGLIDDESIGPPGGFWSAGHA